MNTNEIHMMNGIAGVVSCLAMKILIDRCVIRRSRNTITEEYRQVRDNPSCLASYEEQVDKLLTPYCLSPEVRKEIMELAKKRVEDYS